MNMISKSTHISFDRFENHVSKTLDENFIFSHFSHFTDVTLVSDDNKHFSAHKLVLSSSSPLLREILLTHPTQEPVIYFPSVKHQELKAMISYMYQGSVTLAHDRVEDFKSFARQIKVKGLSNTNNDLELKTEQLLADEGNNLHFSNEIINEATSYDEKYITRDMTVSGFEDTNKVTTHEEMTMKIKMCVSDKNLSDQNIKEEIVVFCIKRII